MSFRSNIKGGSPFCRCGLPRRKGGYDCLKCHRDTLCISRKIQKLTPAQKERYVPKKVPVPRQPRAGRQPRPSVHVDIEAALAPVWPAIDTVLKYAEAFPIGVALQARTEDTINALLRPRGLGYRFRWTADGQVKHTVFNTRNPNNKKLIK